MNFINTVPFKVNFLSWKQINTNRNFPFSLKYYNIIKKIYLIKNHITNLPLTSIFWVTETKIWIGQSNFMIQT